MGVAFGIGASTILDLRTVRLLYGRPVTEQDLAFAGALSAFVRIGLVLLVISGLGLLLWLWLTDPDLLANPKLHAKLTIVAMLTLNGCLIEVIALPLLRSQCGRPLFDGVSYRTQVAVLAMGVVSATSWYLPFLLGIAPRVQLPDGLSGSARDRTRGGARLALRPLPAKRPIGRHSAARLTPTPPE